MVDAAPGTGAGAFALTGGNVTDGFVRSQLRYDAANGDFYLVGLPGQARELTR